MKKKNKINYTPTFNRVLISRPPPAEEIEADDYKARLFIPEQAQQQPREATVLAIGPDCKIAEPGDHVLTAHKGTELILNGETLYVILETDIFLVENDNRGPRASKTPKRKD